MLSIGKEIKLALEKLRDDDTKENSMGNCWAAIGEVIEKKINPIGSICVYTGQEVPKRFLPCDGQSLLKEKYPELFSVIKYQFGGKDNMFKIPNLNDTNNFSIDNVQYIIRY